jgi:hypothetical protein
MKAYQYGLLALLGVIVYVEIIKPTPATLTAGSVGTPNAIGVPTVAPTASVSAGSSVLTAQQTGTNLFAGSGLGNNPVPVPTHELMGPNLLETLT